jgi:1-acyl-sn-glycerol-3-phosphate acyltransferase
MRYLLLPFRLIYCIYAVVIFITIMLLIFPFAFIASFYGRIKGGNTIMALCRFWSDTWHFLIFIYIKRIYQTPHDKRKAYIFVINHISYLDAAVLPAAFRQHIRPLAKVELGRIPVFGFLYRNATVSVDRNSPENRIRSVRLLISVIKKGISVLVFPEGTFNMTGKPLKEFFNGAFRVAIETGTPIKPILFLDTYDRMHYANFFSLTPGRCRIVYLDEIPVAGLTLKDADRLKQQVYDIMEQKLIEYRASWIKS